ncbi:hypothetical protein K523DRAFT_326534, partial [Schizophyllum commune Tattone D]
MTRTTVETMCVVPSTSFDDGNQQFTLCRIRSRRVESGASQSLATYGKDRVYAKLDTFDLDVRMTVMYMV